MTEEKDITERTVEENINVLGQWVSKHITTIMAVFISAYFIFNGTVDVIPTSMGIKEQIIMVLITIVTGYSIKKLIGEQGFTSAKNSSEYLEEKRKYDESVKKALKHRDAINEYSKDIAKNNLKEDRIKLCESVKLYYYDIFDDDGNVKQDFDIDKYQHDDNYRKKRKAYYKALAMTIVDTDVFCHSSSNKFGRKKRANEKVYKNKKRITSGIVSLVLGTTTIGIMFVWVGFNLGSVIYAFMQVVLWIGTGIIDRVINFNFIISEIMPQFESDRIIIDGFEAMPNNEQDYYINIANKNRTHKVDQPQIDNDPGNNL